MNGHSDVVGMIESGEISYEDFESPSFAENKNENSHCLNCGSLIGQDCGDAEADYNDCFCSKLCILQWRK